ncbi:MAG: PEP-CTERM sorting domain-containing protein [Colwellia sp.]|nr:PEP-CTERM sorting domain-containing protein [Colwellia sp.]
MAIRATYSTFSYQSTSVVSGSMRPLGEIEFFGTKIPEPSTIAIFALGMIG